MKRLILLILCLAICAAGIFKIICIIFSGNNRTTSAETMTSSQDITESETYETHIEMPKVSNLYSESIPYIAKTVYGEARGCATVEQAAVIWCILNRVETDGYPDDIIGVVTQANAFHGYNANNPVTDSIHALTIDVLERWEREKNGQLEVGRVLPREYLWFYGDGDRNYFTDEWRGGNTWDWSLENPY